METIRTGGCACGAVRYAARGTPKFIPNCLCRDCRRATGAPFSTWVGFDTERVSWEGERAIYRSSPSVSRGYCAQCGTPLSYSFFFQAEDGIRVFHVTGVQTCALPI